MRIALLAAVILAAFLLGCSAPTPTPTPNEAQLLGAEIEVTYWAD